MLAWLQLTPNRGGKSNKQIYGLHTPSVIPGHAYLATYLDELGIANLISVGESGGHFICISHIEIEAWSRMTKTPLTPFEVSTLRDMSASYCAIANNPKSPCPIAKQSEKTQQQIDAENIAGWIALSVQR